MRMEPNRRRVVMVLVYIGMVNFIEGFTGLGG